MPDNDVQFHVEREESPYGGEVSFMARLVMKLSLGLVKNERQATYVLIGFIVLLSLITIFVIFRGGGRQSTPLPPGAEIIELPNEPPRLKAPIY
ncbi:MAG: hypothetical protein HY435_00035 [Candidatus Liptonbacteria bacterium]|nr:hypothetical protein [Candidatus Liptonbacteria bacterium]